MKSNETWSSLSPPRLPFDSGQIPRLWTNGEGFGGDAPYIAEFSPGPSHALCVDGMTVAAIDPLMSEILFQLKEEYSSFGSGGTNIRNME